ncbi:LysR substrate-binding domain-containing protein [Vibrio sp. SS-MA-C1-2]|uniref:LysR substrate-binding domain-containing protein n=1 Tax=Vibrio sp. SS-MA-C1-2 TaxID=2908646 RepID=UPI001F362311|nr:LysR substrate-binding domain-containing protein [Vibrio sp. SS-MA-C1-2]UJF16817.1 LysR substrate-binding domain-containing protein [Vibrio sp. SS-MA-C1-2]
MKLQQLRYIVEIVNSELNMSLASERLFTTQPNVSKQVRLLEQELGVQIFERNGKHLSTVTAVGEEIITSAIQTLLNADKIKVMANNLTNPDEGVLNLFTTQTIANYILPPAITEFIKTHPKVELNIFPSTSQQINSNVPTGLFDLSVVAQDMPNDEVVSLPCYIWTLSLVVPKGHPLTEVPNITLEQISQYPLVSYDEGSTGRNTQDTAFKQAGLTPSISMTAIDADVIKTYVELEFGIGIIATVSANDLVNYELDVIDISHLFSPNQGLLCFKRGIFICEYMYQFIFALAPHLTKSLIERATEAKTEQQMIDIFSDVKLPVY